MVECCPDQIWLGRRLTKVHKADGNWRMHMMHAYLGGLEPIEPRVLKQSENLSCLSRIVNFTDGHG